MTKLGNNQRGFAIIAIPITLALVGLIGSGVFAGTKHEKEQVIDRDFIRQNDLVEISERLAGYFSEYQIYPLQTSAVCGFEVLEKNFDNLPNDPLIDKGLSYCYWSDGKAYTLRYFKEAGKEEVVVFSK
ncbi:MAG: hypothetical protein COU22_02110 [Candidatus Komeilibacteria bacterium CG10_big_fil_rev_8_21_14_0_10_41_13]|uniref:Type II secretion system protein GspG C-terminal domain-containing protein n=1 Tax=Candidatus Komeilibacteria bacterium CG10_big_fil_rev_8_21_14_0_10_41_13 TaxID=1974476 RepID=A0A2M6WCD9_9BACT|nr:MAG: hypothetical protein COU22_02110 [Candidatus Komeilibacteria bacterium CG10_big_fil_rev_8_21_14_0_10_41_13]